MATDSGDKAAGLHGSDGQPQFFSDPGVDRLAAVMLNLASEVWVQDERLRALERSAASVPLAAGSSDQALKAFIGRVFSPLREPALR